MKNIAVNLILVFLLSGSAVSVCAQTNINLEKIKTEQQLNNTLKFIDDIELVPSNSNATVDNEIEPAKPVEKKYTDETIENAIERFTSLQFKYSIMLDMEVENITNLPLYNFIEEWWGTRYRYGGSTKQGIDCSAFAGNLINTVYNINLPRTAREQFGVCEIISRDELKEGDLVFFNTRGGVSHVGVYLGNNYFVHSSVNAGVTISSLNDDYYGRKFINGGRIIR